MKSKNAKPWLFINFALMAYSSIGLFVTPELCDMPDVGISTQRYAAPAVAEPFWESVKTFLSGYVTTGCYAPVNETSGYGWTYTIATVLRVQAFDAYLFWLQALSIFVLANAAWIAAIDIYRISRKKEDV